MSEAIDKDDEVVYDDFVKKVEDNREIIEQELKVKFGDKHCE